MRILDRYLLAELWMTFLAVLLVLLLITFGTEATKLLAMAVSGQLPSAVVAKVLLLKIPPALEVILPLSALLGVMLAFGRLYQDQEMVVMSSCGIPPQYFQKIVMLFLLPLVVITAWITLVVTSWSFQKADALIRQAQVSTPVAGLVAGKFNMLPNQQGVFYAKTLSPEGAFTQAWIELKQPDKTVIMMAPKGHFEWQQGTLVLVLFNGQSYEGLGARQSDQPVVMQQFARFEGGLPKIELPPEKPSKWALDTKTLWQSEQPSHKGLLAWRIVVPVGVLVMGLLGLKLSKTRPREGRFAKLFIAIVLYVIYNQLLVTERDLISEGRIEWWWGLWPVPLLFLAYALYLPEARMRRRHVVRLGAGQ